MPSTYEPPTRVPDGSLYVIPAQGLIAMCVVDVDNKCTIAAHDRLSAMEAINVLRVALDVLEQEGKETGSGQCCPESGTPDCDCEVPTGD